LPGKDLDTRNESRKKGEGRGQPGDWGRRPGLIEGGSQALVEEKGFDRKG